MNCLTKYAKKKKIIFLTINEKSSLHQDTNEKNIVPI